MASRVPNGFTLIELLVTIAILALLVSGLLASYNNYNQSQSVRQNAQSVKANVRLAQSRALAGVKPASGCTELVGYTMSFTVNAYSFQARCSEGLVGSITQLTLSQAVSFSPVPSSFTFGVLTRGLLDTESPVTIPLSGFNKTYTFSIEPNGTITDNGFQ